MIFRELFSMSSIFKISTSEIVRIGLVIALCLISVAACSRSARPGVEPVSLASVALILLHGAQSGIGVSTSMEAIWISSEKQWDDLLASVPADMLEILPEPTTGPDVDYTKHGVLLIRMGEKPNGGYRLTLAADEAKIENREARIQVHMSEPEPDYFYTQAIVYPHLLIKMEKGAFDSIAVVDQKGSVKLRLSI
jgi:hypothetical protein